MASWLTSFRRTTSTGQYLTEIDGLRFLAIFPVLVQHLSERLMRYTPLDAEAWQANDPSVFYASRGTVGVFLFFAISGFILALPFIKHFADPPGAPLRLKAYFLRRLTRLEPPYILWMSIFFAVLLLRGTYPAPVAFAHYMASLFYAHNLAFSDYSWINPVAWSLEVEVQFYLLAPLLTAAFFSIRPKQIRRAALAAALIGAIAAQQLPGMDAMPWKATLAGQLPHFLAGFILADFYWFDWSKKPVRTRYLWDALAVAGLFAMPFSWSGELGKSLVFALALLAVLVAAFKGRLMRQLLQTPLLAVIGGMCYTIYLIHLPLMELLVRYTAQWSLPGGHLPNLAFQMALVVPIVLALSALFFLAFEKPFMHKNWMKNLFRSPVKPLKMSPALLKNLWVFLLVLPATALRAQTASPIVLQSEALIVRPVDDLIAEALIKSPLLKAQEVRIEQRENETKLARRKWADYVLVNGNYQLGNNLIYDAIEVGGTNNAVLTDRSNTYYNIGAAIRLPFGDLWSRNVRVRVAAQETEIERLTHAQIELQVREAVIREYTQVQTWLNVIRVKTKEIENRSTTLEAAEKYFLEGALPLSEYNEAIARLSTLEESFEKAKGELMLHFFALKELTGASVEITEKQ
ncbi:MAG: hypothetical protein KIPDCIKN_04261 [Haliscomenobacter sp.]|jgi:peptidoglycan/LPS O-acetylase OafA/YrhL|nr:hypothetical protein [Haliscomenobacter sp.]